MDKLFGCELSYETDEQLLNELEVFSRANPYLNSIQILKFHKSSFFDPVKIHVESSYL